MSAHFHIFLHDELLLLELSELCYADKLNYTLFIFLNSLSSYHDVSSTRNDPR